MLIYRVRLACCICFPFSLLCTFSSTVGWLCFFQRPLQATTFILCLLVRPNAVRYQPWSAEIYLRSQVARDLAVTHTFIPFHAITGHKLVAGHLRMAPEGLFQGLPACGVHDLARPDLPARLGTPVDLRSTSIRGRGFTAYLSACGGQLLNVRCAHYAGGASLSTFGFVTIVPRYLLLQVIPSHSFAALTALVVRRVKGGVVLPITAKIAIRPYCTV